MIPDDPSVRIALAMLLTAIVMLVIPVLHYGNLFVRSVTQLFRARGWASRERRLELDAEVRARKVTRQPIGYRR